MPSHLPPKPEFWMLNSHLELVKSFQWPQNGSKFPNLKFWEDVSSIVLVEGSWAISGAAWDCSFFSQFFGSFNTKKKEPREATAQQRPEVHPRGWFFTPHLVGCVDAREVLEREEDVELVSHPNLGTWQIFGHGFAKNHGRIFQFRSFLGFTRRFPSWEVADELTRNKWVHHNENPPRW